MNLKTKILVYQSRNFVHQRRNFNFYKLGLYDYEGFDCYKHSYQTLVITPNCCCYNWQINSSEQIWNTSDSSRGLNTKELLLALVQEIT